MPPTSAKNAGLTGDAVSDLGLDSGLPGSEADDEEEKKKKLQTQMAQQRIQQALGNPNGAATMDLGLGA